MVVCHWLETTCSNLKDLMEAKNMLDPGLQTHSKDPKET